MSAGERFELQRPTGIAGLSRRAGVLLACSLLVLGPLTSTVVWRLALGNSSFVLPLLVGLGIAVASVASVVATERVVVDEDGRALVVESRSVFGAVTRRPLVALDEVASVDVRPFADVEGTATPGIEYLLSVVTTSGRRIPLCRRFSREDAERAGQDVMRIAQRSG